jgi:hypothetical protein
MKKRKMDVKEEYRDGGEIRGGGKKEESERSGEGFVMAGIVRCLRRPFPSDFNVYLYIFDILGRTVLYSFV